MVSISLKGKYGLAAVFKLAECSQQGPVQIKTLAEEKKIPQNYLEQILVTLKRSGIVKSVRGSQGGYLLAKTPRLVTVKDVLIALEGDNLLSDDHCGCPDLKRFWRSIDQNISKMFDVTLDELIKDKQRHKKMLVYSI